MILEITIYKDTGKYYASTIVDIADMDMCDSGYAEHIRNHVPGRYSGGYVTVRDAAPGQSFHNALYTWGQLFPEDGVHG